jgi:hypothetical protein
MPEQPDAAVAARTGRSFFVRRDDAMALLEVFLVTAVGTILLVRAILAATGWPQLGGGKIHFAHLLWGGLGMLIAIILFLALQGRLWRTLGALSAGIGFGLFIDELGKFITSDNDYFFQPVIAIIYVIFVVLFLLFRWLGSIKHLSPQMALVNAFDYAKEAVLRDMDEGERTKALSLLGHADQSDPVVASLADMLRALDALVKPRTSPLARAKAWGARKYGRLVDRRWFRRLVVGWFVFLSLVSLLGAVYVVTDASVLTFAEQGAALSALASGALVVVGIVRGRHSRLTAYHWFERAMLVSILVGEFFQFYAHQFGALFGLLVLLVTFVTIRYMIGEEQKKLADEAAAT